MVAICGKQCNIEDFFNGGMPASSVHPSNLSRKRSTLVAEETVLTNKMANGVIAFVPKDDVGTGGSRPQTRGFDTLDVSKQRVVLEALKARARQALSQVNDLTQYLSDKLSMVCVVRSLVQEHHKRYSAGKSSLQMLRESFLRKLLPKHVGHEANSDYKSELFSAVTARLLPIKFEENSKKIQGRYDGDVICSITDRRLAVMGDPEVKVTNLYFSLVAESEKVLLVFVNIQNCSSRFVA